MECRVSLTKREKLMILQQRYNIFVDEFHFFAPREDGKKVEYDHYDEHALLLGVWEGSELIASCRLVLPNTLLGLPTSNNLIVDSKKFQKDTLTAEISRITVTANHRTFKKTIVILQVMQKTIDQISNDYGISQLIGAVEPSFLRLLNCSKLPYVPIGPLQYLIGAERYPVMLSTLESTPSLKECL